MVGQTPRSNECKNFYCNSQKIVRRNRPALVQRAEEHFGQPIYTV